MQISNQNSYEYIIGLLTDSTIYKALSEVSIINTLKLKHLRILFIIVATVVITFANVDATWAASGIFSMNVKLSTKSYTCHYPEQKTISVKNLQRADYSTVRWTSSDSEIAKVKKTGVRTATITAKAPGTATITAKVNGRLLKCKVTVRNCSYTLKKYVKPTHNMDGYRLYVCKYNKSHQIKKTIPKTVTVNYERTAEELGKTDGKVSIHFKYSSDHKDCDTLVAYWANSKGVLSGYQPIKTISLDGNDASWDMLDNRAIPSEATQLRIYWTSSASSDYSELVKTNNYSYCSLKTNSTTNAGNLVDTFWVYSDIHITDNDASGLGGLEQMVSGTTHYIKSLEDMSQVKKGIKHFIVGDITETGISAEYERFQEIVNESDAVDLKDVYIAIGNHDLFATTLSPSKGVSRFAGFATSGELVPDDLSTTYYHININGIDHIILGGEKNKTDTVTPNISSGQLDWFENEIAEVSAASKGKPIFVYLHNNVSLDPSDSNATRFTNILKKYPNVILFSGHTHDELIHTSDLVFSGQNDYGLPNEFNTSAVINQNRWTDSNSDDYTIDKENAEGYLVQVYDNAVIIQGRSYLKHEFITNAMYVVNY